MRPVIFATTRQPLVSLSETMKMPGTLLSAIPERLVQ